MAISEGERAHHAQPLARRQAEARFDVIRPGRQRVAVGHDDAAPVLDSDEFYADCRGVLVHGGLMAVNLFGRDASFAASAARIASAFGSDQVWSLRPTREGNTVVVAARGVTVPDREALTSRAEHIESRYGLPARKWLRMVRPLTL